MGNYPRKTITEIQPDSYTESPSSYRHELSTKIPKLKENIAGSKNFFNSRSQKTVKTSFVKWYKTQIERFRYI